MTTYNNIHTGTINKLFTISMLIVPPIFIFAPMALWIPLVLTGIVSFFSKNTIRKFIKVDKFIIFSMLSLVILSLVTIYWTPEPKHALRTSTSFIVLLFSTVSIYYSLDKIRDIDKKFSYLYLSILIVSLFVVLDLGFNLGIKPWFSYSFDIFFSNGDHSNASFLGWKEYNTKYTAGLMGSSSGHYNRSLNDLLGLCPIVDALNWKKRLYSILLLLLVFIAVLLGDSVTLKVVIFLGSLVFIGTIFIGRIITTIILFLSIIYIVSAPFLLGHTTKEILPVKELVLDQKRIVTNYQIRSVPSKDFTNTITLRLYEALIICQQKFLHRDLIWNFSKNKILENPFKGYGLTSSRFIGKNSYAFDYRNDPLLLLPLHPHNHVLQIWLELGLLGIIIFIIFLSRIWILISFLSNDKRIEFSLLSLSLFSAFIIGQSSFGLWQFWWMSALAFCYILGSYLWRKNYLNYQS